MLSSRSRIRRKSKGNGAVGRRLVTLAVGCSIALLAGPANASASTLSLSATPVVTSGGTLGATIIASGISDTDTATYGGSDELDVFAAPAGSQCAGTAEGEDQALGFPSYGDGAYPGLAYVSGSFSQQFDFDSGASHSMTYVFCGYLSYEDEFGATEATADTTIALSEQVATTSLSLHLSTLRVAGKRGRITVSVAGSLASTDAPAAVAIDLEYPPCSRSSDMEDAFGYGIADHLKMLPEGTTFGFSFVVEPFYADDGTFSSGGRIAVCAYLGQSSELYSSTYATFSYRAPPQPKTPPTKPTAPTQRQKVEDAVVKAAAEQFGGTEASYNVQVCRRTGSRSWLCVIDSLSNPSLGRLEATVAFRDGHYYVGPFSNAP